MNEKKKDILPEPGWAIAAKVRSLLDYQELAQTTTTGSLP